MKKRVVSMLMAGAMMLSCFTGMTMSANAANTTDTAFNVNNAYLESYSAWRDKTDSTTVYVYPTSGPDIRYMVQGRINPTSEVASRSAAVVIPMRIKGSITNTVKKFGGTQARLKFTPGSSVQKYTSGVWSPDSTKDYTVYP